MKRVLPALGAICALALAACGAGPAHHRTRPPVKVPHPDATVSRCTPSDEAMQCVLQAQPAPTAPKALAPTASQSLGIDFTLWGGCPSPSGHAFGISYISYDSAKDWTQACLDEWHRAGAATLALFEASGNPSGSDGAADARAQASRLAQLGAPAGYPIILAVDCDCSTAPGSPLYSYFRSADSAEPGRIDAYGGYDQVLALYDAHLVGHQNYQTYAWSGGRRLSCAIAPLYQYLDDTSVDFDRSCAATHGGWLLAPGKPAPPATRCYHKNWPVPLSARALCLRVRKHDSYLGVLVKHETSYLKISSANLASVNRRIAGPQHTLKAIEARAATELRNHEWSLLGVSAANANRTAARLTPLASRRGQIQARVKTERARLQSAGAALRADQKRYGWS